MLLLALARDSLQHPDFHLYGRYWSKTKVLEAQGCGFRPDTTSGGKAKTAKEYKGWHASTSRFGAPPFPWPMCISSIAPSCLASVSPNGCPKRDRFTCHTECVKNQEWLAALGTLARDLLPYRKGTY